MDHLSASSSASFPSSAAALSDGNDALAYPALPVPVPMAVDPSPALPPLPAAYVQPDVPMSSSSASEGGGSDDDAGGARKAESEASDDAAYEDDGDAQEESAVEESDGSERVRAPGRTRGGGAVRAAAGAKGRGKLELPEDLDADLYGLRRSVRFPFLLPPTLYLH
jgi:hypothetical protein